MYNYPILSENLLAASNVIQLTSIFLSCEGVLEYYCEGLPEVESSFLEGLNCSEGMHRCAQDVKQFF